MTYRNHKQANFGFHLLKIQYYETEKKQQQQKPNRKTPSLAMLW